MGSLTKSPEWLRLVYHYGRITKSSLVDLFDADPGRFDKFSISFNDILVDYSKNLITSETLSLLLALAKRANLGNWIEKMFSGARVNNTEHRAALHVALRNRSNEPIRVDGWDVMPKVNAVLAQMARFTGDIHSGLWKGATGKAITDIVNIGIGGSDLGPSMVCTALKPYATHGIRAHFVSNVDATHITETLKELNPGQTLFIIASKTFTTQETITNAKTARQWILKSVARRESDIAKHFVAISTNEAAVREFGIDPANMFGFWNWVGGRFSLWSAIGLPIALYCGMDNFIELLSGAHEMDNHFRTAPFESNLPVILALLGIWYVNFFNARTHAVIPYDQYLEKLPDYLQQLEMESNGKSVNRASKPFSHLTSPVVWGKIGTDSQHSFFQLIHQGTQMIPVDFLAPVNNHNVVGNHHQILLSNVFAQTGALMLGKNRSEVQSELEASGKSPDEIEKLLPHKVFPGNKPTTTILYKKLTPRVLGSMLAMYEHKTFVQGVLWNINPFDQWGVELGKQLAQRILPELGDNSPAASHDSSTNGLINYYKKYRE